LGILKENRVKISVWTPICSKMQKKYWMPQGKNKTLKKGL
jgi:hypothetical protein